MKKVVVAMSGGVDSSVAAALMVEQGYEVIGIMLRLWSEEGCRSNRCCTPESVEDASLVADQLGIPFYVRDYKAPFRDQVVEAFIQSYQNIETPNPCLICNKQIRFGRLLEEALGLGADALVTGHYVQTKPTPEGMGLFRGLDPSKDQSYVLYQLDQHQLRHCHFPLGAMRKPEVRALAQKFQLSVSQKPDSQDLCFVGDGDYRDFLKRHGQGNFPPGPIVDLSGKVLGQHQGLPFYTIGQRRGLGISGPEPYYVVALDANQNQLVVAHQSQRGQSRLIAESVHYIFDAPPVKPLEITAKIRYTAKEVAAKLTPNGHQSALVEFAEPLPDITPGQAVVFYLQDMVLGGGIISKQGLL